MSFLGKSIPLGRFSASQLAFESHRQPESSSLPTPNPTRSFWIDSPNANPLAAEGSEGRFTNDADICIIGSGITGTSVAYHLSLAVETGDIARPADQPLRVRILEARDFCRNGGHLTPAVFVDFCGYKSKYGTAQAIRAFELENHTASEIVKVIRSEGWTAAVDLVEGGHTTAFFQDSELESVKADFEAAKLAGLNLRDVRWLTKEQMDANYGTPYPGVEMGGFNLWPLKFVTHLYRLAQGKAGAKFDLNLHTRTPVTSITPSASPARRWAVHTPRGVLSCSYVIHATNAYASHLLPHMSGAAGIVPTRGQVIALRASAPLAKCSWDGNEGFEYWFPRPVSGDEAPLVILGGGREVQPDFEFHEADDSSVSEAVGAVLRRFLPAAFPGKFEQGREPEEEWTGIMGFTRSKDPFVGPVMDKSSVLGGQYISAGYSGHGMPRAFSCAAVVASMVASDISGAAWQTPEWFPEAFLTAAGSAQEV
ncbi:FAD dependent oxidoreductase [Mycena belliarum]|uniref:FAD dependent oxidoreductase n=1 Tax=Mycena belliarum TaxID=1033014 RepID=A0AAD6UCI0_9AGAR|nr:FAD dependent oxidoreductase [Mycena belliae]